jgi:hypothetical protein
LLTDCSQFCGHKSELDFCIRVALDLSDSFEAHCCNELVKDYLLSAFDLFIILGQLVWTYKWDRTALMSLNVDSCGQSTFIINLDVLGA